MNTCLPSPPALWLTAWLTCGAFAWQPGAAQAPPGTPGEEALSEIPLEALPLPSYAPPPGDSRLDQRLLAEAALRDGNALDALAATGRWLELLRLDGDPGEDELAQALALQAAAQRQLGQLDAAIDTHLQLLDEVERVHGRFSAPLVEPMVSLGQAFNAAGRYPEALVVGDQARYLARRNHGLFGLEQAAGMLVMSDAHGGLGERAEARELREQALALAERKYGPESPALLSHLDTMADWYAGSGLTLRERRTRERMLALLQAHHPEAPERQTETLRAIARSWQSEVPAALRHSMDRRSAVQLARLSPAASAGARPSREALQRAQAVLDTQENPSAAEQARMYIAWGDWHMIFDREATSALENYREAWRLLEEEPELRESLLGRPTSLYFVPPPSPVQAASGNVRRGSVTLGFTVDSQGRASDIVLESPSPEGTMDDATIRQLENTGRYRPRFQAGEPVATPGARLTQVFRYRPAQ